MAETVRIPVGTHYRAWWFWLPIIIGGLALLAAAVLLPIAAPLGILAVIVCGGSALLAVTAGIYIERGRRWVELSETSFRFSDRNVQTVIADEQVTDLALHRQAHHGAGKLLAETRHLVCWVDTEGGTQRLKLTSRMAPGAADPLQPLIDRLRTRLGERAMLRLAARETVSGDGWALDATQLHVATRRQKTSIRLEELSAAETIGQEIRLWQHDNPYTVARLPLTGRNGWLLERLLSRRLSTTHDPVREFSGNRVSVSTGGLDRRTHVLPDDEPTVKPTSPMGRILFERSPGAGSTVLFGVMGLLLGVVGSISLWVAIRGRDPMMLAVGGLLVLLCGVCIVSGIRIRRIRFRCYEQGLERITMTGRKLLPFDDIDVFSFESRRNQSQGRYTGTTYTLVFADRSREQGRGVFYSTTVRNQDAELDDLRERVSGLIARRMAQTFAAHRSVQWTPEIWFRSDAIEFTRRRRLFVPAKTVVVPYDTITDYEQRDGLCHIWASYQNRAVLSIPAGAPNFYPGLILLEGLTRTRREPTRPVSHRTDGAETTG